MSRILWAPALALAVLAWPFAAHGLQTTQAPGQGRHPQRLTVKEITERSLRALGPDATRQYEYTHMKTEMQIIDNRGRFESLRAMAASGVFDTVPMLAALGRLGDPMPAETFLAGKDRALVRNTIPFIGTIEIGRNGNVAWMTMGDRPPIVMPPEQMTMLSGNMNMVMLRPPTGDSAASSVVGTDTTIEGIATVRLMNIMGRDTIEVFYDRKTWLTRAMRLSATQNALLLFEDYRLMAGVMTPAVMRASSPEGITMIIRTKHLDHEPIDSAVFAPPATIRDSLARRPPQ